MQLYNSVTIIRLAQIRHRNRHNIVADVTRWSLHQEYELQGAKTCCEHSERELLEMKSRKVQII